MSAVAGAPSGAPRRNLAPWVIVLMVVVLAVAGVSGHGAKQLGPVVAVLALTIAFHRRLLRWHSLVGLIVLVILFVPIDRYSLPGSLPFNLELYRIVVALVVAFWIVALLIDPGTRLRSTPFDLPLLLLAGCILASEMANPGRVNAYGSYVIKSLTFFLSFWLVYYLTATTLRQRSSINFILKMLAIGAAIIGFFAIVEERTRFNVFDHLHSVFPILTFEGGDEALLRGGNLRVFGPSEHPIALGAALIMLLPIAMYFVRVAGWRWWIAAVFIVLGALASGSRTAITMLVAEIVVFLILKPVETKRLWPLCIPAIVVVHSFLPGAIGGFRAAFFPKGGIVAEQSQLGATENGQLAGGRIRQIKPMVIEASHHPFFGEGLGTRITGFNAPILDNQWLNNLLDVGFVGFGLWLWLFVRTTRRLVRESRSASAPGDDWLFAALAAAVVGFGVGMLTFDAFGFTQIFFLFWIVLGLSAALIAVTRVEQGQARPMG
jgi:hypothetical protein